MDRRERPLNDSTARITLIAPGGCRSTRRDLALAAHLGCGAVLGAADVSCTAGLLMHVSEGFSRDVFCLADPESAVSFALDELRRLRTSYASLTFKAIASDRRHVAVLARALAARGHRLVAAPVAQANLRVHWCVRTARMRYASL